VTVAIDQAGHAFATSSSFTPTFPVPSGGTSLTVRSPLGGWSDATALDPGGLLQQVVAEPTGAVSFFVERDDGQGGREEALTSRLPDGSQAGPAAISSPDSAGVRVATDLAGNMLGTWTRHPDGQARGSSIVVAERPRTGVFGSERLLSPTDSIGSDAALTDGGQAVVAWLHARESGNLGSGEIQARVREDRSLPVLPFPPDVDIDAPADPALAANGTLKVPVQCSRRCKVSASGLLFTDGTPRALAPRGATHKLRGKRRRGRVTLVFPADAATAARAAGRAVVAISVRARGRSPRPVIFSRQITLKR
jgi:hypothetical protein